MSNPLYRVRSSGMGGSGYAIPPVGEQKFKMVKNADSNLIEARVDDQDKTIVYPGVTTVIKVGETPDALIQWSVDQTAAYAVYNIDSLLTRTEEQGWRFLRFYHSRKPDLADPLRSAHNGVLNDLAELGTNMHDWMEWDLTKDGFPPAVDSPEMEQMIASWETFRFEHDVKVIAVEQTVYGFGFAGTYDLIAEIDGVRYLLDIKTSRSVREGHYRQLAALNLADRYFEKVDGVWVEGVKPAYDAMGFIHIRPDDLDAKGSTIPSFCELVVADEEEMPYHEEAFLACLRIKESNKMVNAIRKRGEK